MNQKTYELGSGLKTLTDDELSRLFHICKENVDLLAKLMPGHPWLELLRKNPNDALKGLVFAREISLKKK